VKSLSGCIALLIAVGAVSCAGEPAGHVGGRELGSSLSRAIHAHGGWCTAQPGRDWWWCEVELDVGTIGAKYQLRADSSGCWHAVSADTRIIGHRLDPDRLVLRVVKVPGVWGKPKHVSGCVDSTDQQYPNGFSFDDDPPPTVLKLAGREP
jgi:hypothetical protein